jgi:hypothetical protein
MDRLYFRVQARVAGKVQLASGSRGGLGIPALLLRIKRGRPASGRTAMVVPKRLFFPATLLAYE